MKRSSSSIIFCVLNLFLLPLVTNGDMATWFGSYETTSVTGIACSDGVRGVGTVLGETTGNLGDYSYLNDANGNLYVTAWTNTTWNSPNCLMCLAVKYGANTAYVSVVDQDYPSGSATGNVVDLSTVPFYKCLFAADNGSQGVYTVTSITMLGAGPCGSNGLPPHGCNTGGGGSVATTTTTTTKPAATTTKPATTTSPATTPAATSGCAQTYLVASGDTGTSIANNFGIPFQALNNSNPGVNWSNLQINQSLCIPGTGTTSPTTAKPTTAATTTAPATTKAPTTSAPTTSAPTSAPTTKAPTTSAPTSAPTTKAPTTSAPTSAPTTKAPTTSAPSACAQTYLVASGDTGNSIATHFGIPFQALNNSNPGVNWSNLQINQALCIPGTGGGATTAAPATTSKAATTTKGPASTTKAPAPTPTPTPGGVIGIAPGATTVKVQITTYAFPDNDAGSLVGYGKGCYSDAIARTTFRPRADEGSGTFSNPNTCAVSVGNSIFPKNSIIYIGPPYYRFCRTEDDCSSCTTNWIDLWIGPNSNQTTTPMSSSYAINLCGTAPGPTCNCDSGTCGTGGCESDLTSDSANILVVPNANANSGVPWVRRMFDWSTGTCADLTAKPPVSAAETQTPTQSFLKTGVYILVGGVVLIILLIAIVVVLRGSRARSLTTFKGEPVALDTAAVYSPTEVEAPVSPISSAGGAGGGAETEVEAPVSPISGGGGGGGVEADVGGGGDVVEADGGGGGVEADAGGAVEGAGVDETTPFTADITPVAVAAVLPMNESPWEKRTDTTSGHEYYYNKESGVTQWEVPDGVQV